MPSITDVDSTLFRHLTGRAKPKIPHPTSNAFDFTEWLAIVPVDYSDRDETLIRTALLINREVSALREYIAKTFTGLSPSQMIRLSVAIANRSFLLIRQKSFEAAAVLRKESGVTHVSALSQVAIVANEGAAPQVGTDLNTAVIDSLPHWFAAAMQLQSIEQEVEHDFSPLGNAGQAMLSLENTLREIWQEVLWEPWAIENTTVDVKVFPRFSDDQGMWRAWHWREESLLHQRAIYNRHLERGHPELSFELPIPLTVRTWEAGDPPTIGLDGPDKFQSTMHRSTLEMLDDSYVSIFLDDRLTAEGITPRLLARSILVLQDLLRAALPNDPDPASFDTAWTERMSCLVPRHSVVSILETTLDVPSELADAMTTFLTSDPWGSLGTLFSPGIWHRPLIADAEGANLMIVAGALVWGSMLRSVERWLQAGKGTDLTKTTNGLRFESRLRELAGEALALNPILELTASKVVTIPKGAGEEIDLVVRLGRTVIVGEIKCFLGPADPIERYDYLRKLEDAAEQANRKAAWLAEHREVLGEILTGDEDAELRFLPFVIVNQSNGASWTFDGCTVVDEKWFLLFLASGDYHSAAAISFDGKPEATFVGNTLYRTAEEAEANIPSLFVDHPGLKLFREAVDWSESIIPLSDGRLLRMAYPLMDVHRYVANFPISVPAKAVTLEGADESLLPGD